MKNFYISITVVIILLTAIANARSTSPYIVGGQPVAEGEMPYIGSLIHIIWHNCTVTILSNEWVLTAAQCIWGHKPFNFYIRVGSLEWETGGTLHSIASGFLHEHYLYDDECKKNDIAVIKVTPPFIFNEFVQPVVLADRDSDVIAGTRSRIAGWGSNAFSEDGSDILMKTDLEIFSDDECLTHYGEGMNVTQICAGLQQGGSGICLGDAGSPLMIDNVQVGVASWTRTPCGSELSVASQISYYRDWIYKYTGI